jgi:hypothetical protein
MITDEIRKEKQDWMLHQFHLACIKLEGNEFQTASRLSSDLLAFSMAFTSIDWGLFQFGRSLVNLYMEFLATGSDDFNAFCMLKACEAFKGLKVDPAPAPASDQPRVGSADVYYGPLDPSIATENNRLATGYMADRPHLRGGVVIVFKGQCSGWMNELRNPDYWEPGCFAVDRRGNQYLAIGGDFQYGATSWNLVYRAAQVQEVA